MPKADPELARAVRAAWKPAGTGGPRAWAERLQQREERGERLTQYQAQAWRRALKAELATTEEAA